MSLLASVFLLSFVFLLESGIQFIVPYLQRQGPVFYKRGFVSLLYSVQVAHRILSKIFCLCYTMFYPLLYSLYHTSGFVYRLLVGPGSLLFYSQQPFWFFPSCVSLSPWWTQASSEVSCFLQQGQILVTVVGVPATFRSLLGSSWERFFSVDGLPD